MSCVTFDKSHNLSVVHMVRAVSVNRRPREESVQPRIKLLFLCVVKTIVNKCFATDAHPRQKQKHFILGRFGK